MKQSVGGKVMDSKQNRERMESGKLYFPADEAVMAEQTACMERLWEYNHTRPSEGEKRSYFEGSSNIIISSIVQFNAIAICCMVFVEPFSIVLSVLCK